MRARINVLSEIPDEWQDAVDRWSRLNASKKSRVDGEPAPDRNDEYLLYQTLIGVWPAQPPTPEEFTQLRERVAAYILKATKEAKVHTSWINPNEEYDAAVGNFVLRVLAPEDDDPFLGDLRAFQRRLAYYGQFNALAQVLLKLASPGVPDIYQGTELWDFSLVDPDNRRPVDYQRRCSLLAGLKSQAERSGQDLTALARELLDTNQDGRIKLYLISRTPTFRRVHHDLFSKGAYVPVKAIGDKRQHVCAFARTLAAEAALVVAPRLVVGLTNGVEKPPLGEAVWGNTWLPLPYERAQRRYGNIFTGEVLSVEDHEGTPGLPLASVCGRFPVALLERIRD